MAGTNFDVTSPILLIPPRRTMPENIARTTPTMTGLSARDETHWIITQKFDFLEKDFHHQMRPLLSLLRKKRPRTFQHWQG